MKRLEQAVLRALQSVPVVPDYIKMAGGLDLVTSPLERLPGTARAAQNFEVEAGADKRPAGYRRIAGYERYDGRQKPSDASYSILQANISGAPAVGNTLTGATSGATGEIIALPGGSFVLTKVVGVFQNGENLNVGGPTIAVATSVAVANSATAPVLHAQYKNLAADEYRNDIAAVPGSGAVLGVWRYNNITFAWRNNVGATAAAIHKSTAGGWVNVPLGEEVSFTAGGLNIDDGDTLTQGGVTATVKRVVLQSGSFAGGTGAGRLVIFNRAGGNFAAGAATTTGGGALTLSGAQTAITIQPSGTYEFHNANFGGSSGTKRIYGCDRVSRGFEFDGTDYGYVPIVTGMSPDTPNHVREHKNHLFFAFSSSAQHSGTGLPYVWSPVFGAAELAMGDEISGFMGQPGFEAGGALAIFTRNRTSVLYGSSVSDWNLVPYREELGAYARTIQDIGFTVFLDDRGITNLQTAQEFGNFAHATMSDLIRTLVSSKRTLVTASCISRDRSQYRLFFSDATALYMTVQGRRLLGVMPMQFPDVVRCICSLEDSDGSEAVFFGSDDGFVYELDKGTSFDGDAIEFFLDLAYNFAKSPRTIKRYHDAMLELSGSGYAEFSFGYFLGYGSADIVQPGTVGVVGNFATVLWDAFTWDAFTWDGQTLTPSIVKMDGEAENYSIGIRGSSDIYDPFTLSGAVVHYSARRRMRGTS